jgi:hypothetical protein
VRPARKKEPYPCKWRCVKNVHYRPIGAFGHQIGLADAGLNGDNNSIGVLSLGSTLCGPCPLLSRLRFSTWQPNRRTSNLAAWRHHAVSPLVAGTVRIASFPRIWQMNYRAKQTNSPATPVFSHTVAFFRAGLS